MTAPGFGTTACYGDVRKKPKEFAGRSAATSVSSFAATLADPVPRKLPTAPVEFGFLAQ